MARPPNEGETEKLEFRVPAGLHQYLTLHAKKAIIGASPGDVARFLLTEYAVRLMQEGYMGVKFPPDDSA